MLKKVALYLICLNMENIKIKLLDEYDENTYQPYYITSVGPCRIWWEWRRVNKSTSKAKKVLDF